MDDPNIFGACWDPNAGGEDTFNMLVDFDQLMDSNNITTPAVLSSSARVQDRLKESRQDDPSTSQAELRQSKNVGKSQSSPWGSSNRSLAPSKKRAREHNEQSDTKGFNRAARIESDVLAPWDQLSQWNDFDLIGASSIENGDIHSCSACSDVCPSECGEVGQGSICCDDENCEAQGAHDLCVSKACEGVISSCTDENCSNPCSDRIVCMDVNCRDACVGDAPCAVGNCSNPCTGNQCFSDGFESSGNAEEAAAAAALTSFGHTGDLNSVGSLPSPVQFNVFDDGFSYGSNQSQHLGNMCFTGVDRAGFNDFSLNSVAAVAAPDNGQRNAWSSLPQIELFNHLKHYHDPSHDHGHHVRPCLADNPDLAGARCPLPNPGYGEVNHAGFLGQDSEFQCGFSAQDPAMFANHVVTQHRDQLSTLPACFPGFSPSDWNFFMQSDQNGCFAHSSHTDNCQVSNRQGLSNATWDSIKPQNFFASSSPKAKSKRLQEHAHSASTDSITSARTTPFATPDTALTGQSPPPLQASAELGVPERLQNQDLSAPSQSLGPQNAYQCFWVDPKTGLSCLQNFEDSDALDAHCRDCHTRNMEKTNNGFRCLWQSCRRGSDCFQTKAKLNRHLQTHTGFKPLQCHICFMRLSAKQALEQHIRTHTNEQPYKCEYCDRTFKQHSAMTMHIRTHTKEKPLKCEICGALFTESSNLSKHRRTHSTTGMFKCELCGKDFHRLDQLRRHLNSNHRDHQPEMIHEAIEKAKGWRKKVNQLNRAGGQSTDSALSAFPMTELAM